MNINYFLKLLIITSFIYAKNGSISGLVIDYKNQKPLIGANVFITESSIGTSTDEKGFYKLNNVKNGTFVVKASYIGYKSYQDTLEISDSKDVILDFKLKYTTIKGQEILVTAQARGQLDAINQQLNARSIKNIVSSDRIQELPDANVAETVARIPGVSIKREGGEGNKVVVRGLSPKYNSITVDGTRLASTDFDDRSTDLSMISQNILEGIEVTKAGTPDLDADALGGTVNFKLKRAKPGFHGTAIMQGIHNNLRNTYNDNKLVFDISNRFWENKIGILTQIDVEKRNRSSNEFRASYDRYGLMEIDSTNLIDLISFGLSDIERINDRQNTLAVLDINIPNGNISYSNLNSNIVSDINAHVQGYGLEGAGNIVNRVSHQLASSHTDNGINVLTENWKYKQQLFLNFNFEAYKSYALSENRSNVYRFNFSGPGDYMNSELRKNDLRNLHSRVDNNPQNTYWDDYNLISNFSKESEKTIGVDGEYNFNLSNLISGEIKLGFKKRLKQRNFDRNVVLGDPRAGDDDTRSDAADALRLNFPQFLNHSSLGYAELPLISFIDQSFDPDKFKIKGFNFGAVPDLDLMMDVYRFLEGNFSSPYLELKPGHGGSPDIVHNFHQTESLLPDHYGSENYQALYGMIDFNIRNSIEIITGFRQEVNTTEYTAYRATSNPFPNLVFTGERYTHNRKNKFILPALFLKYKPFEWLNIRAAWTNTLTRPNYTDIIPLAYYSGPALSVMWRNQDLTPGRSNNRDFSINFNQSRLGFLGLSYFTKSIKNLIFYSGRLRILTPEDYGLPGNVENWSIENYTSNNKNRVLLQGLELDYQTRFWYLPGILSGLVLNANYTLIKSEAKYPRTSYTYVYDWDASPPKVITTMIDSFYVDRLIDQPNKIMNISFGYDYKGFSGRLSMLYKTDVFTKTDFWPELRESTDDYKRWDLSIKQKLPIKGFELFFNANNIAESTDISQLRGSLNKLKVAPSMTLEQHYGKTFDLGFRFYF